jgi:hypothetical protein
MLPYVDWWTLLKFRKNVTHTKGKTVQEDCSRIALPPKRRWFTNRHDVTSQTTWNTATRTSDVAVTCSPHPPAVWGKMLRFHNPENAYWGYWIVSSAVRCKGRSCLAKNGHSCSHIFTGFFIYRKEVVTTHTLKKEKKTFQNLRTAGGSRGVIRWTPRIHVASCSSDRHSVYSTPATVRCASFKCWCNE